MSTGAVKLGVKSTFNLNTGSYASPVFSACTFVSDLNLKTTWDKAEAATRVSRVKTQAKTMMGLSHTGKLRASDTGDTNYQTINAALIGDTVLNVMILNGGSAENGSWGFMYDCQLSQADEDLGLGVAVFDDIEIIPYPSGNPPQYALVTSGAPVFTQF
jgi:hypothetical protein